jgi:uncharacterized membrane protein
MTPTRSSSARRLSYVDWMRGLAILIMIEAHVLDAWTRPTDRGTFAFGCATILAGFAAPMFLFLSGVSVALGAGARARRLNDAAAAAASVRRRGWQILGLAYLFRFQAYLLNPKAMLAGVLKVDILNVMGPCIVAVAALWQVGRDYRKRILVLGGAALTIALLTPLVRTAGILAWVPAPLQAYLRPIPGRNNFTFFPWSGFVFAGGLVGVLLDRQRSGAEERRFHLALAAGALLFAAACYAGSYLPSVYAESHFWTTSPMFFFLRAGLVTAVLSAVYCWERRPRLLPERWGWAPMARFGQASLFVYWVHVELVYGFASQPLHKNLSFQSSLFAFAGFSLLMFGLAIAKNRTVGQLKEWRARRERHGVPEPAM